jgi:hypothetical protein
VGEKAKDMRQFSQAGHSAMMNIGDARLAIFNGDPNAPPTGATDSRSTAITSSAVG